MVVFDLIFNCVPCAESKEPESSDAVFHFNETVLSSLDNFLDFTTTLQVTGIAPFFKVSKTFCKKLKNYILLLLTAQT